MGPNISRRHFESLLVTKKLSAGSGVQSNGSRGRQLRSKYSMPPFNVGKTLQELIYTALGCPLNI
jgi:hypothetical protein